MKANDKNRQSRIKRAVNLLDEADRHMRGVIDNLTVPAGIGHDKSCNDHVLKAIAITMGINDLMRELENIKYD